jgi:thiol-disulfide isomerase/thioredoxin
MNKLLSDISLNRTSVCTWILWMVATLAVSVSQAQVLIDPVEAFRTAQASGKPILIVFSGSDWCAPCIRLEREVLSDSAFLRYAGQYVVLLKADFPQRKKSSQSLQSAYEKLADAYNQEGTFPKLLVVSEDKKKVTSVSSVHQTPATLTAQLQRILNRP